MISKAPTSRGRNRSGAFPNGQLKQPARLAGTLAAIRGRTQAHACPSRDSRFPRTQPRSASTMCSWSPALTLREPSVAVSAVWRPWKISRICSTPMPSFSCSSCLTCRIVVDSSTSSGVFRAVNVLIQICMISPQTCNGHPRKPLSSNQGSFKIHLHCGQTLRHYIPVPNTGSELLAAALGAGICASTISRPTRNGSCKWAKPPLAVLLGRSRGRSRKHELCKRKQVGASPSAPQELAAPSSLFGV